MKLVDNKWFRTFVLVLFVLLYVECTVAAVTLGNWLFAVIVLSTIAAYILCALAVLMAMFFVKALRVF